MLDQHLLISYLKDINVILEENKNFFAVFNINPKFLTKNMTRDELESAIINHIQTSKFKNEFNDAFDYMEITPSNPTSVKIFFHFNHDDFTTDEKENLINNIQSILI